MKNLMNASLGVQATGSNNKQPSIIAGPVVGNGMNKKTQISPRKQIKPVKQPHAFSDI